MKYMGSKRRLAKYLLPIILKNRKPNQWYIEPFVGGFNMIDKVEGNRIGNDIHYYLIELFKAIQYGWEPPSVVTEEDYNNIKNNKYKYHPRLVGFVGFTCSYASKWFGGYARGKTDKGALINFADQSKRSLLKQRENLKNIVITNKNYRRMNIPKNSIIYCDPPYANTTKYNNKFDHEKFWNWVRLMKKDGHNIFISEYNAPNDFKCVWKKDVNSSLTKNTGSKKAVERLFV